MPTSHGATARSDWVFVVAFANRLLERKALAYDEMSELVSDVVRAKAGGRWPAIDDAWRLKRRPVERAAPNSGAPIGGCRGSEAAPARVGAAGGFLLLSLPLPPQGGESRGSAYGHDLAIARAVPDPERFGFRANNARRAWI